MKRVMTCVPAAVACSLLLAGCGGNVSWVAVSNPVVAGGLSELPPEDGNTPSASLDLGRVGVPSPDPGSWRDHEIAARGSVLAIVHTGNGQVRADVSLDRGASFPIQQVLDAAAGISGPRLVQCAIAPDYTLAFFYWRAAGPEAAPRSELCVVEATPTGFDVNDTPAGYAFQPAFVIRDSFFWMGSEVRAPGPSGHF